MSRLSIPMDLPPLYRRGWCNRQVEGCRTVSRSLPLSLQPCRADLLLRPTTINSTDSRLWKYRYITVHLRELRGYTGYIELGILPPKT